MGKIKDMLDFKTDYITVLKYVGLSNDKKALWECMCKCGNIFYTTGKSLRNKSVTSCGCKRLYILKEQGRKNKTHGDAGIIDTRLYRIWHGMKKRCNARNNREAKNYGDKGITYATSWESYPIFKEWALKNGYSDTLTLDRIDCTGNYTPKNCRWVDMKVQQNNRSNTVYVKYRDEIKPRAILAKELGLTNQGLIYRLKNNIPLDKPKKFIKKEDLCD